MTPSDFRLHRTRQERARRKKNLRRPVTREAASADTRETCNSVSDDRTNPVPAADPSGASPENLGTGGSLSCLPDPAAPSAPPPAEAPRPRRRVSVAAVLGTVFRLMLLAAEILLLVGTVRGIKSLQQRIQPVSYEVRCLIPGKEDLVQQVPLGGSATLPPPAELDGYTFLCWEAPDGRPETRSMITPDRDTVYVARYALAFPTEEHIPYLSVDGQGIVDVNASVTVRETVITLYRLLNLDRTGKGSFLDVKEDDPCYTAAATLKELGVLSGDRLYPDDLVSRADLLSLLSRFYPPADSFSFSFSDLTEEDELFPLFCLAAQRGWIDEGTADPVRIVSRGEFARILNRVLGRSPAAAQDARRVGMILDVPPSHPYYADVAEAVIPHQYTIEDGTERWTQSTPLPLHEPGLFFAGVRQHLILPDGRPAVSAEVDGRFFNESGELSTGNAELDFLLWDLLDSAVDPGSMTPDEMLHAVYERVCSDFSFSDDRIYPFDTDSWAASEALLMLQTGEGSSYGYAALFYELAYLLGYQPQLVSGIVYGQQTQFEAVDGTHMTAHAGYMPHAWVEITEAGIPYHYDPSVDASSDAHRSRFRFYDPIRWQQGYRHNY